MKTVKLDYGEFFELVDIPEEYRPTHATNLLILFSKPKKDQKRIVDLGCGVGISSVMISKIHDVEVLGIDVDHRAISIADELVRKLGLSEKVQLLQLDVGKIRDREDLREKYDLVVSNPPHHFEGKRSPNPLRESVKRSSLHLVEDFVRASSHLLKNGGELLFILTSVRLPDVMESMRRWKIEPKIMVPIYGKRGKNCELIVLRGRKNGKPGFSIETPMFLSEEGGKS